MARAFFISEGSILNTDSGANTGAFATSIMDDSNGPDK